MLNEIEEVKTYLTDPNTESPRLCVKLLANQFKEKCKLNGIEEILILIASHYLYDFIKMEKMTNELKDMVILILRIWCGFEEDVSKEELAIAKAANKEWFLTYPDAEGWLRKYHEKHLKEKGGDWTAYSNEWKEKLKSKYVYQAKKITYENILAQALVRGSLKEYCLMMKNTYESVLINDIRNAKEKKPDKRKQPTILKFIAAYKLLQRWHPGQKYVLIPTNRILSWMGFESDNTDRWCLDITWKCEPLFMKVSGGDYHKFSVNQAFLNEMDVQLLDYIPDVIPNGYDVYCDEGKDNSLRKLINIQSNKSVKRRC